MPLQINVVNTEWNVFKLDDGWQLNFVDPDSKIVFSVLVSDETALQIRRDLGGKPIEIASSLGDLP